MYKISLTALALFLGLCHAFGQKSVQPAQDTATYSMRALRVEEVNLVSGYYQQTGQHAAVTGGIGSEALIDFANNIDLKFSGVARNGNKHYLSLDMGIDHYTSASSDKIDPRARQQGRGGGNTQQVIDSALLVSEVVRTSASYEDQRYYPSFVYIIENPRQHWKLGVGASYSMEWDYVSRGISASFNKGTADGNREWGIRAGAFFDTWSLILPVELRTNIVSGDDDDDATERRPRNTFETSFSLMQVINRRLQLMLLADIAYQKGYLSTSFNRVFFEDGSLRNENLPDGRLKTPVGIRANYFVGDRVVARGFYRFYRDNWGMQAHTLSLETSVKLNSGISLSPHYRFHTQQAVRYFAPYKQHAVSETHYSSDYDLSGFQSHFAGLGLRYTPAKRTMLPFFNALELRGGFFRRSDGLQAWIVSAHLKLK